ncbi:FMN-dependent NADH-azoreductase [Sphingomonas sp. HDW15A]|uniref:FMN-dependent NADH-azoreductase n=1 Tax=Sphingomonas sp. HDW15A TaxID=2714942 RepID=UPI00140CCD95|nr:NAD(P)H-dependent oxidoreductase [Sphingomonas sp. HDW15A]QIK95332.1 FMN-dependent NADH-azoreductase [Sphingomonas sp. HDW15A]
MTILHIDSSISGEDSVSRRLTRAIVGQLAKGEVVYRDLAAQPLSHLTERGQDPGLLDQFIAADTVVIGAPMYNFSIPTQLKAWLDRLAVAGKSFRYTESGPEGLLGDKRVIVALASGGVYEEGSLFEHQKSYLKAFFNFIGIEPEFVSAFGIGMAPTEALERADAEILALAA